MSDQTPSDQAPSTSEGGSVDVTARLANLTAPRPTVASIWPRREAAPIDSEPGELPAPPPTAAGRIGRLTRVTAAELWTDGSALATWIAGNVDALADVLGVEGMRLRPPTGATVLGTTADGSAACVVCEISESSDEALGALLRAAAVQDGGIVVWLNGGSDDAHVAAVSWLNRATPPRFYLVKATGVRIGESASAPMFELVVRPPRAEPPAESTADAPQRRVEDHVPED